jgi:hypothetical protein
LRVTDAALDPGAQISGAPGRLVGSRRHAQGQQKRGDDGSPGRRADPESGATPGGEYELDRGQRSDS